jgi:hypothetical protein
MNTATALIHELEAAGFQVSTDGTSIILDGPHRALTPELRARQIGWKTSIITALASRVVASCEGTNSAVSRVPRVPRDEQSPSAHDGTCPPHDVADRGACVTCGAISSSEGESYSGLEVATATPIVVDFETRAPVPLDQVGGRVYARHPAMEVLCAVLILPDGTFIEWIPGCPAPQRAFDLIARGTRVMAHNAHGFDRFVWQRLGWPEASWIDSLPLARIRGLPGKLEALADAVLDIKKDVEGRALTLALGRLDRSGRFPDVTPTNPGDHLNR